MQRREFHQVSRLAKTRVWTIQVDSDTLLTEFGELGGKLQRVTDRGHAKNVGRANEISAAVDAENEAERAILKRVREGYAEVGTESASTIDWYSTLPVNFRFYKPENQLSETMLRKAYAGELWFGRKRDGEMMVLVKGPDGRVDVYSRTMMRGHHLEVGLFTWNDRFPLLVQELEAREDIPPRSILLGDVVAGPGADQRWQVASYMKRLTPEIGELPEPYFYCWDIAFWDGEDLVSTLPIGARYGQIWQVFSAQDWQTVSEPSRVLPVDVLLDDGICAQLRAHNLYDIPDDVIDAARLLAVDLGYEGWVAVDPSGVYGDRAHNFRGKTDRPGKFCGKIKPVWEGDFVARFDPDRVHHEKAYGKWGNGNHRGQVGSVSLFQYNAANDLIYVCECGGGIDDAFRVQYSAPWKDDRVLQVEYTDRTYVSTGDKTNALTFPRVVCLRDDKQPAECVNDLL